MLDFEVVEDAQSQSAPELSLALRSPLEALFVSYEQEKAQIERVSAFLADRNNAALHYFFEAAAIQDRWAATIQLDRLFRVDPAIKALDATYWQRAILLTDVLEVMAAEKRNSWNEAIRSQSTPSFEREAVTSTLRDLLLQRERFFCERVDGLFRRLSGKHVTNVPEGFSKRMILEGFLTYYGTTSHERVEYLHDLRFVIASFLGRESPSARVTHDVVRAIHQSGRFGTWHDFDGGAFKLKLFKKGTAHIEVHPDIAWRLNMVLAKLHPSAIPANFRQQKATRSKEHNLSMELLSERAVVVLNSLKSLDGQQWRWSFYPDKPSDDAQKEAVDVLQRLGAVRQGDLWVFDYDARESIQYVIRVGRIPDDSYQFYATPESMARLAVDMADIEDEHTVLEPSAGQGGIAQYLPVEQLTCVEVSALYCTVLRSKGLKVIEGDFLALAPRRFDRIIMNPPFSNNRAKEHVIHAADRWLTPGGRLVAILPASLKGATLVDGYTHEYSEVYHDQFAGTRVSVVILVLDKPQP